MNLSNERDRGIRILAEVMAGKRPADHLAQVADILGELVPLQVPKNAASVEQGKHGEHGALAGFVPMVRTAKTRKRALRLLHTALVRKHRDVTNALVRVEAMIKELIK